ncbi:hypothetical protein [Alloalcanivorax gelatiniphagus]|uniref:Uncharacterized protein n=1 Tax=Alloalcanivorax gelatiniphagus TaxID=1194167 RepID=A0ABY2XKJ1_9GAMM|nr:hypothetical protein [Alloalcanivorax gelatiniphagus]TMW12540.1 hypothetical protein FGS76_10625 [Alloalcanivorax gelatiniphagus]
MGRNGFRLFSLVVGLGAALNPTLSVASVLDQGEPVNLYAAEAGVRFVGFDVAALPGNEFAVTWLERNAADQTESLRVARFEQNGQRLGDALILSETPAAENYPRLSDPVIGTNSAGDMVVVWNSGPAEGASECREFVQFRLVDSNGTASPVQLFFYPGAGFNCNPEVAMNEQGLSVLSAWYGLEDKYLMQLRGQDGTSVGGPMTRGQNVGSALPMAVALQESSGMAVWSEQEGPGTVLLASRFSLTGGALGDGDFRFDNNAHDANGLYQSSVSLDATADGGYLGAWLQTEDGGGQPVYSQHIQRWRADGTAAGSARVGGTSFDAASDRIDLDAGAGSSAILAWTDSGDDGARKRYATVVHGNRATGDAPAVIAQSDAALFDSSALTRVALANNTAMVLWYEQDEESNGPVLKARIGTLPEPAAEANGGGGGGGPMGPVVLLGALALLLRKKTPGGEVRPA